MSEIALQSLEESTARINIWEGSVRSSKTITSIIRWLEYSSDPPPGKLVMVGKTERTLKRNILDPVRDMVGSRSFHYNRGLGEVRICGRTMDIVGANDERAEQKIRGMTCAGLYGDELTLWPESFFTMALSRLSVKGSKLFGTTNPDHPHHWLKEKYLDREGELNLRSFHFTLSDNLSLDPQYIADLEREYTGLWRLRMIKGLWVAAEGAVYDAFDESIHVVDDIPRYDTGAYAIRQYWAAADYGTTNPCVFLLCGLGIDNCLYVIDEWRYDSKKAGGKRLTDPQYSERVRQWLASWGVNPRWIWLDPSAASFMAQLHNDRVKNLAPALNDVPNGIRRVSALLGLERLKIHRRCKGLISEMSGYVWDPKHPEGDVVLKRDDHGPDALRYFVNGTQRVWRDWTRHIQNQETVQNHGKAA
jgi:PBSX family phage terminase large subunit